MSFSIRADLVAFSGLKQEWKETKEPPKNLSSRIEAIQNEAVRCYAAALFSTCDGSLLRIVEQLDPALHGALGQRAHDDGQILQALRKMKHSPEPIDSTRLNALIERAKSLENDFLRSRVFSKIAYLQEDERFLKEITSPTMKTYAELKLRYHNKRDTDCCELICETIGAFFLGIPLGIGIAFYAAAITTVGVGASLVSVATGGTQEGINDFATKWTAYSKVILALPYRMLWSIQMPKESKEEKEVYGIVTKKIACPIFEKAQSAAKESDFLKRHMLSRCLFFVAGIVSLVSRAVDLTFGLAVAAVSIFPLFLTSRRINTVAFVHLQSLAVIFDAAASFRGTINPHQFLKT